jgi:hypothetical protein
MQSSYPEAFEREMGCTEAEWLGWLSWARVAVGAGSLDLRWTSLPPRRIALVQLPRLAVSFRFEGVSESERFGFMRYFDLYMQRGGG